MSDAPHRVSSIRSRSVGGHDDHVSSNLTGHLRDRLCRLRASEDRVDREPLRLLARGELLQIALGATGSELHGAAQLRVVAERQDSRQETEARIEALAVLCGIRQ